MPAFKDEPYITTPSDYLSSIHFELQSIKYPNGGFKSYSSNWDKVNKNLLEDYDFGKALNADGHLKDIAKEISTKEGTPQQKACTAYEHISNSMLWNNAFRKYTTNTLRKAYNDHTGSSADINLNLVALCRLIGLNADPVIVSTRSHGMVRPGLVSKTQFNHVIAAVKIDGKYLLMDATDKNCPYNLLPSYCLNGRGRLVNEGMGEWVDLYSKTPSSEVYLLTLSMNEELDLHGDLTYQAKNYAAINARNHLKKMDDEESYVEEIEEDFGDVELSEVKIENADNHTAPFILKSKIELKNRVMKAGDLAFLNPKIINRAMENIFKREERVYPVDYNYPIKERYILTI